MPPYGAYDMPNTQHHVKDIKAFGDLLDEAASAAFPNRGVARYKEVHVLLLSWEDDNLGVIDEVVELEDVFRQRYHYQTEIWEIPSKRSHNSLAAKIVKFLNDYESQDNLLIVYYGGHGEMNDDRQCVWLCTGARDSPEVQWYALQTMLEQAQSDALILLDCCAAASSAAGSGNGITEIVAACGFETWAPGVGQHSFTRSLIDELEYLHRSVPYSTSFLHNKVLSRVKYWKPRFDSSASHDERRKTPIYIALSGESKSRSIELEVLQLQQASSASTLYESSSSGSPSVDPELSSHSTLTEKGESASNAESSSSSISEVWPDEDFKCPKVLISVALEEEQWLSTQQWDNWIRSIPALVRFANIEGVYKSDSTLLICSIPIAIWNLIPSMPAISFIGLSRSHDLLPGGFRELYDDKSRSIKVKKLLDASNRPSRTDPGDELIFSTMNPGKSVPEEMSDNILSDIHNAHIKRSPTKLFSPLAEPLVPEPPSEVDWERSTVSTSSYGSSVRNAGVKKYLPSLPSTVETSDEVEFRSDFRARGMGPKKLQKETKPASVPQRFFNNSQLSALAVSYINHNRERMWRAIADDIGADWQNVEFNCLDQGLNKLETIARFATSSQEDEPWLSE